MPSVAGKHYITSASFVNIKMYKLLIVLALASVCVYTPVRCARIVAIFPFAATSHYILGNALLRGLAEAGHNVTMISPHVEKNPPKNGSYRDVVLTGFLEEFNELKKELDFFNRDSQSPFTIFYMYGNLINLCDKTLGHPNVKALLESNEKFDAVIVEEFTIESVKVLSHLFNAPLIVFNSVGAISSVNAVTGNPSPSSYVPHHITNFPTNMTFFQRVKNLLVNSIDYLILHYYVIPKHAAVAKKHFPDTPDFYDIYYNTSLILLNSHESLYDSVPLVPSMVEIGGFHISPPKKLPKDLQKYLDGAKHGVIYFSLGSNLKSRDLPPERRDMFLRIFSKLKEEVLWKWEDDVLPGQPPNVKIGKWLPQQDILAHPNVKLFITHGGLLSTIETVYHGVPILAIPVFADQHSNALTAVTNGYARSIAYRDPNFTEEKLSELFDDLLNNPKYTENIKRRSQLFHDRPMKPMETAVFWVEYVIRNGGAPHLRVAGAQMPLSKYLLLDVIGFLVVVAISVVYLIKVVFRLLCRRQHSKGQKVKTN